MDWLKCLCAAGCLMATGCGGLPAMDSAEAELRALESGWNEAIVRKDKAALQRILADDFVIITADGQVGNKDQLIHVVSLPDSIVDPFVTEDVRVRIYDNTAVLTGRFTQTGTYKGRRFESKCLYTDVYVRRAGQWMAVSAQATCPGG